MTAEGPGGGALAVAGVLALVACGADTTGSRNPEPAPTSTPVSLIEAEIPVGGEPIGIASGAGSIWVVSSEFESRHDGSVTRIDPATGKVLGTTTVGHVPSRSRSPDPRARARDVRPRSCEHVISITNTE